MRKKKSATKSAPKSVFHHDKTRMSPALKEFVEQVGEMNPNAVFPTGYESCVVGYTESFGRDVSLCLDYDKVIRRLMQDKMSYQEAVEFFEYNIIGTGSSTWTMPVFLHKIPK